jgi:hypothetical protein
MMPFKEAYSALRCHMFYGQRVIDINDGKPKWSGRSDLIENGPPKAVKEPLSLRKKGEGQLKKCN